MLKPVSSDIYRLLHPKLAFFVTSISKEGKPNLMACAWATPVSEEPPIIIVCIAKDSYTSELIKETKEFGISIPQRGLLKSLLISGKTTGRGIDKFKKAGVKPLRAENIRSPLVDGCIGYIECALEKTTEAGECYAFFGRVLSARADERVFKKMWRDGAGIMLHLGAMKMVSLDECL